MSKKLIGIGEFGTDEKLQAQHDKVQEQIRTQYPNVADISNQVSTELAKMDRELDEGDEISVKWRAAGYTPSDAAQIIKELKTKNIGQITKSTVNDKLYVLTPFKTVIEAQEYVNVIQKRLMELSSTSAEDTISRLSLKLSNAELELQKFKSHDFFYLIKLAFKSLLGRT